jgi:hypothetical protein
MYHCELNNLDTFLRQCKGKRNDTLLTVEVCAQKLSLLWMALDASDALWTGRRGGRSESAAIKGLRKYSAGVKARAMSELSKESSSKQGGALVRKKNFRRHNRTENGERLQERVLRRNKSSWTNMIDKVTPCPYCEHEMVICMSSAQEHAKLVNQANDAWKQEINEWREDGSNKNTKPRKPPLPKRLMACMCIVNKCKNTETGRGCSTCRDFVTNGATVPYDYKLMRCTCTICQCNCDAVFRRDDWQDIFTQQQLQKQDKEKHKELNEKHAKGSRKYSAVIYFYTTLHIQTNILFFIYFQRRSNPSSPQLSAPNQTSCTGMKRL